MKSNPDTLLFLHRSLSRLPHSSCRCIGQHSTYARRVLPYRLVTPIIGINLGVIKRGQVAQILKRLAIALTYHIGTGILIKYIQYLKRIAVKGGI